MGVPRFFRWVSERYPQILQKILDSNPPEYDNLYLDMNGIIHACSQEFANSLIEFSEDELIRQVCNYVDRLFHTIRPTKLFYMAIDGVAPRSKINQQRQRRFLSVHRDEKLKQQLLAQGKPVPEVIFNRTAITPGTQFMYNLSESIQFYIKKKISEDLSWREVQVIFSGPENPGEGEHKIIDYIRKNKASPEWDSNQSHCLYGLDADLILLGLITHEPNFSILREEISFKPTKRQLDFQLLHISLLREYLDLELRNDSLEFGYDLERTIDDFILIMIFFGNDFLPHLPFLEISKGGLNSIFELYKGCLPALGGYLTDGSTIDLDRLQHFFQYLQKFEKNQQKGILGGKDGEDGEEGQVKSEITDLLEDSILEHDGLDDEAKKEFERLAMERLKQHFAVSDDEDGEGEDEDEKLVNELYNIENSYYRQYFNDFPNTLDSIKSFKNNVVQSYVEGLVWVLNYYHNGCISWTWFYPYYYAPLSIDFKDIPSLEITFEPGEPITPFQQLLSVLPPQSVDLLPINYQPLMLDQFSPIIDYYPREFEIDTKDPHYFDGIAELGFVDHQRLLDATHAVKKNLTALGQDVFTDDELARNSIKNAVIIYHDANVDQFVPSPNSKVFKDIESSSATTEDIVLPIFEGALKHFRYCEDVLTGTKCPFGFPTLKSLQYTWKYQNSVIDVWGMMSRKDSLIIVPPHTSKQYSGSIEKFSQLRSLIGKKCYINWPYHQEARILYFSCSNHKLFSKNTTDNTTSQKLAFLDHVKKTKLSLLRKGLNIYYDEEVATAGNGGNNNGNGDSTGYTAAKLGYQDTISILVHVNKLVGIQSLSGGSTKKRYSDEEDIYPIELMVGYDEIAQDSRFEELDELPFEKRFPVGKKVLFTKKQNPQYYGMVGTVLNHYDNQLQLELQVPSLKMDMNYGHVVAKKEIEYFPIQYVAKQVGSTVSAISQLTAGLFIFKPMIDIGLNLKFTGRQQQVLGYCKGYDVVKGGNTFRQWEFSQDAINLITDYLQQFPLLHQVLQLFAKPSDNIGVGGGKMTKNVDITSLFKTKEEKSEFLERIEQFIEKSGIRKKRVVPCGTNALSQDNIQSLEKHYNEINANSQWTTVEIHCSASDVVEPSSYESVISMERHHIMKSQAAAAADRNNRDFSGGGGGGSPSIKSPTLSSSFTQFSGSGKFHLGDRVVTVLDKGNVPFGTFGTVASIQDQKVDVIFDTECFAGNSLDGFCSEKRGICISKLRLYNLSSPPPPKQSASKFYDEQIDPHEYWEKINSSQFNNNNNNNNNNNKKSFYNNFNSNNNNNNNGNQQHQHHHQLQQNQPQQQQQQPPIHIVSSEEKPLNWQQLQLLNNISNPQGQQQGGNQQQQHQHQNKNNNSINYPMKRKPTYVKSNFEQQEYADLSKNYPNLDYNFYYDANDQRKQQQPPLTNQQQQQRHQQQQQAQMQQQQQQQQGQSNQPPKQKLTKQQKQQFKQQKQQEQQELQLKQQQEQNDPKKQRQQKRLNLIYQNIEPGMTDDGTQQQSSSDDQSAPPTNPSAMLLLNDMFRSTKINDGNSGPQQQQPPMPPHMMMYSQGYGPPPPHMMGPHGHYPPGPYPPPPHMMGPYPPPPHMMGPHGPYPPPPHMMAPQHHQRHPNQHYQQQHPNQQQQQQGQVQPQQPNQPQTKKNAAKQPKQPKQPNQKQAATNPTDQQQQSTQLPTQPKQPKQPKQPAQPKQPKQPKPSKQSATQQPPTPTEGSTTTPSTTTPPTTTTTETS